MDEAVITLVDLPDLVLHMIVDRCDFTAQINFGMTCERFYALVIDLPEVKRYMSGLFVDKCGCRTKTDAHTSSSTNHDPATCAMPTTRLQQTPFIRAWDQSLHSEAQLHNYTKLQMPCIALDGEHVWLSDFGKIWCCKRLPDKRIKPPHSVCTVSSQALSDYKDHTGPPLRYRRPHRSGRVSLPQAPPIAEDVVKFKIKGERIVAAYRNADIACFSTADCSVLMHMPSSCIAEINDMDMCDTLYYTGARDGMVRVIQGQHVHEVNVLDRIWSIGKVPKANMVIAGLSGIIPTQYPPIRVIDIDRLSAVGSLGIGPGVRGAGVLDIQFDSPQTVLTCGYDTCIRLWDLRTSWTQCVTQWEEPYDCSVYCVRCHGNTIVAGLDKHGMTRLWDRRKRKSIQFYQSRISKGPVFSVDFDWSCIYTGLENGLHLTNFNPTSYPQTSTSTSVASGASGITGASAASRASVASGAHRSDGRLQGTKATQRNHNSTKRSTAHKQT